MGPYFIKEKFSNETASLKSDKEISLKARSKDRWVLDCGGVFQNCPARIKEILSIGDFDVGIIMSSMEKMTLEEYKKKVEQCLIVRCKSTTQAKKSMQAYENDFPQFLSWNLTPQEAVGFIEASY